MVKKISNIGLALSGGGIRATIFHLGVIKWMAEKNLLENIVRITTVSGASLGIGLIYSQNKGKWPDSQMYLDEILPTVQNIILGKNIQNIALRKLAMLPYYWNKKVNLLANVLQEQWEISGNLSDLSIKPLWYINCTTYETGKRFRFSQEKMGDYILGYVENPNITIADAIASSAGFPVFIGPYKLNTHKYTWIKSKYAKKDWTPPEEKYIHLWDGGVYDNFGLESIYKMDNGGCLSDGVEYLIISNASSSIKYKKRTNPLSNLKRLLKISMDQVAALRSRNVMDYIKRTQNGMYIKIGNSAEMIADASCADKSLKEELVFNCMSSSDALKVRNYPTTLNRPSKEDFDLILQHGYEVAKCTYSCYSDRSDMKDYLQL